MRIEVGCAQARVVESTSDELSWLCQYLVFEDPQARFTNGSPFVELVNRIDNTFPAGFAAKIKRAGADRTTPAGRRDPIDIELVDVRQRPANPEPIDLSFLRDYQRKAVETALAKTRGVIQMPTGAGKSLVVAGIVASVPCKWLILVPQADLLEQFAKHIRERVGEEPGIIGDGKMTFGRITVATFQMLHRQLTKKRDSACTQLLEQVGGIICDEVHQVASGSFSLVCSRAKRAFYRIGVSATPLDRSDKKSIYVIGQIGGIIHKTSSAELRARGFLAAATVRMVRCDQGSTAPTWPGVYGDCVVRSKARNAVVAEMAAKAQKPALVFINQVNQGKMLVPAIKKLGMRVELVWGEDDTEERRKAIADLVSGKLDVIVCSNVFAQGVDIPSLRSVVNGAGGSSVILTLQRLGRGTRVTDEKTSFEAWDVLDGGHRWLRKHGEARKDTYEKEGLAVQVLDPSELGAELVDAKKDEHGFVLGSNQQVAHRAALRREALASLAGVDKLANPRRGKIMRPHQVRGSECAVCGCAATLLPPECVGYRPEDVGENSLFQART